MTTLFTLVLVKDRRRRRRKSPTRDRGISSDEVSKDQDPPDVRRGGFGTGRTRTEDKWTCLDGDWNPKVQRLSRSREEVTS